MCSLKGTEINTIHKVSLFIVFKIRCAFYESGHYSFVLITCSVISDIACYLVCVTLYLFANVFYQIFYRQALCQIETKMSER